MSEENTTESPANTTSAAPQEPAPAVQSLKEEIDATGQEPHPGSDEPSSSPQKSAENNEVQEPSAPPAGEVKKAGEDDQELKFKHETQEKARPPSTPSKNTGSQSDYRGEPRIHVRWHADVLVEGQGVYHGFVKEISLNGSDFFIDFEIAAKAIRMRIHVPPTSKKAPPRFMEISGKVVYTSFNSQESLYHTGIKFLEFKSESDRSFLEARIAAFNRPK